MDLFDRVKKGDLDYIKKVEANVLLNARDIWGYSVLHKATYYGEIDCCKLILKKCPSLLYLQHDSSDKYTVLLRATNSNNYKLVDYFLSMGLGELRVNIWARPRQVVETFINLREGRFKNWIKLRDKHGDTALTMATDMGSIHIVKRLIAVDRKYNLGLSGIAGWKGKTALQCARENQDHEMITLLIDEGDPYSDYIPYTIAMDLFDHHIRKGDLDYVKTVTSDVLLKSRDENRNSALCMATKYNQLVCCEEILKRCPTLLYHHDNKKNSVLHHACENGFYRLVDLFVGIGLDVATTEGDAEIKQAENMQRFKNWINLQNHEKDTALHCAVNKLDHDIVKIFLQVDRQYKLGLSEITGSKEMTPLQLALEDEDQKMIKLLTEGTDPDFKQGANTHGNISLSIATTQAQEALHTGNKSDSAGTDPDFEDGANTHGQMSLSIVTTQAQEALHTGNNSDTAGNDATDDFYVGEIDKNSSTDSVTKILSDLANEKPRPYTHEELMEFTKEFSDLAGSGTFGDVYKGEFPNGVLIAVKVLKNSRPPELMEKQFVAEVSTMGRTYHRNLIKLYGYCYEADMKALIYEYMEKGALDVILKKNNLDMVKLYTIATEIARGISYLHESCKPQIIHLDLKPANVLLDSEFSPRVIDFGLAKLNLEKSQFAQTGMRGTRGYVAPEMTQLELGMINHKCDVFSFGMILFDILKSKINYTGYRWLPGQVWEKLKENKLDSFLKDHGIKEDDKANAKTLSVVALLCAEYNPPNRLSMSTVVKMLEGEMTLRQPVNPFPHYSSSSDSSSTYDSRN